MGTLNTQEPEESKKENLGRPWKRQPMIADPKASAFRNSKSRLAMAALSGLQLQNGWTAGESPENKGRLAYKAHLSCFWWGRTVVRTVGSQEQVCIWEITPFKTVMSTRIKKKKPFLASLEMYTCGNLERLDRFLFSRPFIGKLIIATVRSTLSFRERQLAVWNQNAALLGTGKTMIVVLMQENVLSTVQLMMSQTAQMDEKEAGSALIWVWRT